MTEAEQLAEAVAWLEDVRDQPGGGHRIRNAKERASRILSALKERGELQGRIGRMENEMEALKRRGREAIRYLQAIDPSVSSDVIMVAVHDALRAMNQMDGLCVTNYGSGEHG